MNRVHTLRTIAEDSGRDKRTTQNWYQRHKESTGVELGEIIDGTRYFSDEERATLMRYAGSDRPVIKPTVTVETGHHPIVLEQPEFPQSYTLEGLRQTESVVIDDPLAVAQQFLQIADQLTAVMQSDIQQRERRLHQTRQAKDTIVAKAQDLKLEQRFYKERTQIIDFTQNQETQALQTALSTLQGLGKPTDTSNSAMAG